MSRKRSAKRSAPRSVPEFEYEVERIDRLGNPVPDVLVKDLVVESIAPSGPGLEERCGTGRSNGCGISCTSRTAAAGFATATSHTAPAPRRANGTVRDLVVAIGRAVYRTRPAPLARRSSRCRVRRDPRTAPGQHRLARCTRIAQSARLNHAMSAPPLTLECPQRDSNATDDDFILPRYWQVFCRDASRWAHQWPLTSEAAGTGHPID
jgi:hypothetical protein